MAQQVHDHHHHHHHHHYEDDQDLHELQLLDLHAGNKEPWQLHTQETLGCLVAVVAAVVVLLTPIKQSGAAQALRRSAQGAGAALVGLLGLGPENRDQC